jgi:alpha-N-acetylglucosamine transferase
MAEYLVYFTVGHNPEFAKLLKLCVKSIEMTNDMSKIDICIMSDAEYTTKYLGDISANFHTTEPTNSPEKSSMRKLEVFNIENIMNYKRILFLDCDIVVTKSLLPIFERATDINKLYVFEETHYNAPHTSICFSHLTYTPEELKMLKDNNILGFNCGQFLFTPTSQMKTIFDEMVVKMASFTGKYFYEQSFMNVFFNLNHELTERKMLQDFVRIFPQNKEKYPTKTIIHFTGTDSSSKYSGMMYVFPSEKGI